MGSLHQSIFLFLLSFLLPLSHMIGSSLAYADDSWKPVRCGRHGPLIRFPFRNKDGEHERCGYRGFNLSFKDRHTFFHFPPLGCDLLVERIDYKMQKLTIADRKNCLWSLLFNSSNLRASHVYHPDSWTLYTLVNCSKQVYFDASQNDPIPCLSDSEHDAFVFDDLFMIV